MLSFVVTAFNEMSEGRLRGKRILDCIRPAQEHDAIKEIVVVDDASKDFNGLLEILRGQSKVRLHQNKTNRGVFGNKLEAIACANYDWVITCDSDNVMSRDYLKQIIYTDRNWQTWYCASFARPKFDYRKLAGTYNLKTLSRIINHPVFPCFFNTGNQVVQRTAFMQVFEQYRGKRADLMMPNYLNLTEKDRQTHYWRLVFDACDSFLLNYHWILAGNKIEVVEGLEYDHYYATGDEGNYSRSPDEKGKLGNILLAELKKVIAKEQEYG